MNVIKYIFLSCALSLELFAGSFKVPAQELSPNYKKEVYSGVASCEITSGFSRNVVFSWADDTSERNPYFAIYDIPKAQFIKNPTKIQALGYDRGVFSDVFCCYNSINNQVIFSWADRLDGQTPYYAIYDLEKKQFTKGPKVIDPTYIGGAVSNVFCSYNSLKNQVNFSWLDRTSQFRPYYAIYDVKTNTFIVKPTLIDD